METTTEPTVERKLERRVSSIAPTTENGRKADPVPENGHPGGGDPTRRERPIAVGTNRCRCGGCGRHFGGVTGFDAHQTLTATGDVVCHDPATRGLVVIESGGFAWWSRPAPEGFAAPAGRAR